MLNKVHRIKVESRWKDLRLKYDLLLKALKVCGRNARLHEHYSLR